MTVTVGRGLVAGATRAEFFFVIPLENNFLLNPLQPDFRKIRISRAAPFALDPRLYQKK
jgi:hypothetical protein